MKLPIRPRRNRKNETIRALCRETILTPQDLIYPMFLQEGALSEDIVSMPGCKRWKIEDLLEEARRVHALGIGAVVLFPAIHESLKTPQAEECYNSAGLLPRTLRALKQVVPGLTVITDVALDPYNSEGHDGIVLGDRILNDETVEILCKQALCHAEAGADIVAPSDMMDGRVAAIRETLDNSNYHEVAILSYTAKYASCFYGPFRGALDSAPKSGDKKSYQMDPANAREALREAALDEQEGADMLMVKPAGAYLDVIYRLREASTLPIAAYQVSGEYLMIKSAAKAGWLAEKQVIMESLLSIKRAGADAILTYFAPEVAEWL